ncbi:hypothetical protein SCLCIDRAFT_1216635 [Scleroderma citrinum Foug A]|uniref:Uncharacterized protein n=1 Tax=Scleroderma citrinum Foug A TaxID=1036808 RepID=A0A0C3DXD0_9AGAM|nr:hypothetical protein SCLCIDRAFT_1216635 [Scleroderma citrinum Foug A]
MLPYAFEAPIFSAIFPKDDHVVTVNGRGQLIVIKRIPDIMPPIFRFQGIGPIGIERFEISIVIDGKRLNVIARGDEVVAVPGVPPQPFHIPYHKERKAYSIEEPSFRPISLWGVKHGEIFIETNPGVIFPPEQLFRLGGHEN